MAASRDRCKTKVNTAELYASWHDFFGLRERGDLTIEELGRRVDDSIRALANFKRADGFADLPWSEFEALEKDAIGPRKIPLNTYEAFAARYLEALGARALYSVPSPTETHLPGMGGIQMLVSSQTRPATEKRVGDNHVARATILSSLQQLSTIPPAQLKGVTVAFVGINAPDEGGETTAEEKLIMIDVVKGAREIDGRYRYQGEGQEAQVAAHEVAHLTSWRVCGLMVNKDGVRDDPLFASFVPGFTFGPDMMATMTEPGIYRGYIGFERGTAGRVAVARAYGASNPEEAQAVLLGELANNSRFLGRLYGATQSDPTALKGQTALWMARLRHARPASYEYYRLLTDLARVRAAVRARLTPLEVRAAAITQDITRVHTSSDPRLEPLKRQGMTSLKELEDRATVAVTGLPAYPTSALSELRW